MLAALAHQIVRHRRLVIGTWIVLTVVGAFSASQVSKRWFQSFSIPGYSAYEANQRTLRTFGNGERPPYVVVWHAPGDVTQNAAVRSAAAGVAHAVPGARTSSFFSTGSSAYVSKDRHTTFLELYPPGINGFSAKSVGDVTRHAATAGLPAGVTANVTGHDPLEDAATGGDSNGPSVITE